jgi:hypothetical protein
LPENAKKGEKRDIIDVDGESYEATELDVVLVENTKVYIFG